MAHHPNHLTLLLPNHIRTAPSSNPDLMHAARIHIDAVSGAVRGLGSHLAGIAAAAVGGIGNGELAVEDDVGGAAVMGVLGVVLGWWPC